MSTVGTVQSPLVVGRDDVLRLIDASIAEAAAGRGRLLLFAGEAGIGKTRLVRAGLRKAQADGFKVTGGALAPNDLLAPLQCLRDMAHSMHDDGFDELGKAIIAIEAGKGADSLASRRILVHELVALIVAAITGPTAISFEDLQWADELTLEVLGELARDAPHLPLLLLATYRLDELPSGSIHREWRSRLLTQRLAQEIQLDRLDHDGTALVTTLILGSGLPAPREVVDAVYERTNGIPLHIEELLAALRASGTVDGRSVREAAVPDTIEDAVMARVARLSPEARDLADAGAVLGRCFVPEVVAGVLNRPVEELDAPLEELVQTGMIHPFDWIDRGYFDFRHQLLRDAIYRNVPAASRRRFHARAAEFGGQLWNASEIHKSVHYERAGQKADAFRAALASAEKAAAMTSRFEAFELYRRAIANIPDGLSASELGDLYTKYDYAAAAVDEITAMEEALTLARKWYLEAGRPIDAANALLGHSVVARRDVRPRREREAITDQAERELAALPSSPERAGALADVRYFQALMALDDALVPEARARMAEMLQLLGEAGADQETIAATELDLSHMSAWADVLEGRVEDGLARMIELSRDARDRDMEATGVTNYRITADVAFRFMAYPVSRLGIAEGIKYADAVEQSYCRHVMSAISASLAWTDGRWDDAVAIGELELVERGSRRGTLGSRAALAFVAFGRGHVDAAREMLDGALAISRPSGEIDLILPALWGLAETALVAGDPRRAFDHCQEAVALAAPTAERALLVPFVVTGARAALADRRPEVAERWLDQVRGLLTGWSELARPALDHAEGLARLAAGSTVSARTSLESAVEGWDARGRIWEATWARLDLASCLVRSNRYADAVRLLETVQDTADRLGSEPILTRAQEMSRLARSRGGDVEPWHPLSAREFEVAQKIAEGMTNAEIGEELFVSPKTVSAHVEHILAKLGVSRRAEIATWVATVRMPTASDQRPTISSGPVEAGLRTG